MRTKRRRYGRWWRPQAGSQPSSPTSRRSRPYTAETYEKLVHRYFRTGRAVMFELVGTLELSANPACTEIDFTSDDEELTAA